MTLKTDTRVEGGVTIVSCNGRITFGDEAMALRENLKKILTDSRQLVLNLSGVSYIDSGGLGTLVSIGVSGFQ